jgi:hypothetical protein
MRPRAKGSRRKANKAAPPRERGCPQPPELGNPGVPPAPDAGSQHPACENITYSLTSTPHMKYPASLIILAAALLSGCCTRNTADTGAAKTASASQEESFEIQVDRAIRSNETIRLIAVTQEAQRDLTRQKITRLIQSVTETGRADLMFELAQLAQGQGFTTIQRFDLLSSAVEKKHPDATFELGRCYINGVGTLKDEKKGIELVLTSAHAGCRSAQSFVGQNLFYGMCGFTKNEMEGAAWQMIARANGAGMTGPNGRGFEDNLDKSVADAARARSEELWKTCKAR